MLSERRNPDLHVWIDQPRLPKDSGVRRPERQLQTATIVRIPREARLRERICGQREPLMRVAMSLARSMPYAEDLVQETMTRAMERIDSLRDEDRLESWLKQILVNLYRDQFRRKEHTTDHEIDIPSLLDSPDYLLECSEFFVHLRVSMQKLSPRLREVVGLVCISDMSYADAANTLDVPVGTIMSRLWRARQFLRPLLEQYDVTPPRLGNEGQVPA